MTTESVKAMADAALARLRAVRSSHRVYDPDFMQAALDACVGQVFAQGGPSIGVLVSMGRSPYGDYEVCAYRGRDGRKCAIGHLITDEAYNDACAALKGGIEGHHLRYEGHKPGVHNALRNSGLALNMVRVEFLKKLQRAHDNAALKSGFLRRSVLKDDIRDQKPDIRKFFAGFMLAVSNTVEAKSLDDTFIRWIYFRWRDSEDAPPRSATPKDS